MIRSNRSSITDKVQLVYSTVQIFVGFSQNEKKLIVYLKELNGYNLLEHPESRTHSSPQVIL